MEIKKAYKKAFKHLESDPVMKYLISKLGREIDIEDRYNKNYAKAIAELIIEQQISFKVAISIKKKFNHLISGMTNNEILEINDSKLKGIGISRMKVKYIKNFLKIFKNY